MSRTVVVVVPVSVVELALRETKVHPLRRREDMDIAKEEGSKWLREGGQLDPAEKSREHIIASEAAERTDHPEKTGDREMRVTAGGGVMEGEGGKEGERRLPQDMRDRESLSLTKRESLRRVRAHVHVVLIVYVYHHN